MNGDIDVFLAENLKPLTKITLFADSTTTQTGRELYLRKPERLILRVEGRTPTDDAATYSIKFSGSFQTVAANSVAEEPELPKIKSETESEVKVNSVGTIIETKPKPLPTPKETIVANTTRRRGTKAITTPQPVSTIKPKSVKTPKSETKIEETKEPERKVEVIVTDNLPKPIETEKTEPDKTEETGKIETKPKTIKKTTKKATPTKRKTTAKKATQPKPTIPDSAAELTKALENIRLIVEFKDGGRIERPMNDVLKFGVDKGILTITNKDGTVGKYSILEIVKISVE